MKKTLLYVVACIASLPCYYAFSQGKGETLTWLNFAGLLYMIILYAFCKVFIFSRDKDEREK